jgi:hypothetical protein
MSPQLLHNVIQVLAIGLTFGSFGLLIQGGAYALGCSFRSTIEPVLASIRGLSERSRPELADLTILVAIGLAGCAALFEAPVAGCLLAGMMAWSRPLVRRATREENKLLALAGTISIDLVIGVYVPMVMAQLLLHHFFIATSMLAVVVALSWPAGGGRRLSNRTWRLAPVAP